MIQTNIHLTDFSTIILDLASKHFMEYYGPDVKYVKFNPVLCTPLTPPIGRTNDNGLIINADWLSNFIYYPDGTGSRWMPTLTDSESFEDFNEKLKSQILYLISTWKGRLDVPFFELDLVDNNGSYLDSGQNGSLQDRIKKFYSYDYIKDNYLKNS